MIGFSRGVVSPVWLKTLRLSQAFLGGCTHCTPLVTPWGGECWRLYAFSQFYKARPRAESLEWCLELSLCIFLIPIIRLAFCMCSQAIYKVHSLELIHSFVVHWSMSKGPALHIWWWRFGWVRCRAVGAPMGQLGRAWKQHVPRGIWGVSLMEFVKHLVGSTAPGWVLKLGCYALSFSQPLSYADHVSVLVWVRKKWASWAIPCTCRAARY